MHIVDHGGRWDREVDPSTPAFIRGAYSRTGPLAESFTLPRMVLKLDGIAVNPGSLFERHDLLLWSGRADEKVWTLFEAKERTAYGLFSPEVLEEILGMSGQKMSSLYI